MHPLTEKIMSSVKRPFTSSSQKKRSNSSTTPTSGDDVTPSPYRQDHNSRNPPSIDQIAMGLHISRTPHLRSLGSTPNISYPQKHHGRSSTRSPSLPHSRPTSASSNHQTTPRRSSLKKSSAAASSSYTSHHDSLTSDPSATSASLSTITSNTISTPRSSRSFSASFRLRVPWLSLGPSASPPRNSDDSKHLPRKKAVRFTGHAPRHGQDDVD
ncbi:hypothetical protein JOM56_007560 [Amanita muscaria]